MREMMAGMSRVFRSDSVAPILEGSSFVAAFGAG